MAGVARYAKATAKPGQGEALARKLLEVAAALRDVPGCELYVINRSPTDAEVVWVTEVWSSQAELDASLTIERVKTSIQEALPLLAGRPELTETLPLGGVGLPERS